METKQLKKRKRRTSDEQYELYLLEMESDSTLRTGVINPSLPANYLKNKWVDLAEKLNGASSGPTLSVVEWQKRFKDWKNSTRAKYRKIKDSRNTRNRTGGGPAGNLKLTDLEERGLLVWGKAPVVGIGKIDEGGLQIFKNASPPRNQKNKSRPEEIIIELDEEKRIEEKPTNKNSNKSPLNKITTKLLDTSNKSIDTNIVLIHSLENLAATFKQTEESKLQFQKRKLNFEIAKFKFENPNFIFDEGED